MGQRKYERLEKNQAKRFKQLPKKNLNTISAPENNLDIYAI